MNNFIANLRSLIASDVAEDHASGRTLHLAAAALLYEVAMSDQHIDPRECETIESVLGDVFSLEAFESRSLASEGRAAAEESVSLHGFTSLVREHWTTEERCQLMDHLWAVVWADGRLDDHEQHLMRKLNSLLYVPHKRYVAAKLKALEARQDQNQGP